MPGVKSKIFSRLLPVELRSRNHVKLLRDFRYNSCDVHQKFQIYFAAIFVSYLRLVSPDIYTGSVGHIF